MQTKISKLTLNQETMRALTSSENFCISIAPCCHTTPPVCPPATAGAEE